MCLLKLVPDDVEKSSWRMGGGPVLSAPSAEHDQSRCSANSSTHGTYHIRPGRPVLPASNLYSIRCRLRVACRLAGDQL